MIKRLAIFSLILLSVMGIGFAIQAQTIRTVQELADENGQFADIDGVEIYYLIAGEPSDPAVILIHGFGGSTFTWRDNMEAIADAGYYVVALDLPPFGLSDKNPEISYTRQSMADYVAGLMDYLGIERATIVGHSMGGAVTAYFAVNHAERTDKLIFVAGGVFNMSASATTTPSRNNSLSFLSTIDLTSPSAAMVLRAGLRPQTFANILAGAYYDPNRMTDEAVAGYARPLQTADWPYGFLAYIQARDTQTVTLETLAEAATQPVLIIWGEEDTWVPISTGEAMNSVLTNVRMIRYPLVGHLPMEENTEQFNEDIIAFLNN